MDSAYRQEKRRSRRDVAGVLFRRKWAILAVFLSTVIPVTVYTLLQAPIYQAESRILVKPGRENIYVSPVGAPEGAHPPTIVQRVAEVINSEIEIIRSRVLIRRVLEEVEIAKAFPPRGSKNSGVSHVSESLPGKVLKKVGLAGVFPPALLEDSVAAQEVEAPPLAVAVRRVLANLSVERLKGTDVIRVGFKSPDPDIPARFLNVLVERYLERHLEVHQSKKSADFFKAQSRNLAQKLRTATSELAEFNKKYGIVNFEQKKELILKKYTEIEAAIKDNEAEILGSRRRIETLRAKLARTPEHEYAGQHETPDSAVINDLKKKLADLELEKLRLMHKYKPENPKITNVNELMARAKEMLEVEQEKFHGSVSTEVNANHQKLEFELMMEEVRLEALESQQSELGTQLIEYGRKVERLGLLEPELRARERTVTAHEQTYRLYLTKFEESRVSDAMDAAKMVSVTVVEPARPPLGPLPAHKALNIFVSICLGGLAALGLAFLVEYFDQSFKVPEDIRDDLGLPVLGAVRDLRRKEMEDVEALGYSSTSPIHYQTIKSGVVMGAEEKGLKLLCICSPTPHEGCSTIAINIAASLAKDRRCRVVLVDANFRNPTLHASFNLPNKTGFSDIVQEGTDVREAVNESAIPGLFVITSGVSMKNPMAVLESDRMEEVIKLLKEEFEWVLFDCAPTKYFPDSSVLARRLAGEMGVVLVVRAEHKHADIAVQAKESMEEAGGKVLGAVLNRQRYVIPETVYRRL